MSENFQPTGNAEQQSETGDRDRAREAYVAAIEAHAEAALKVHIAAGEYASAIRKHGKPVGARRAVHIAASEYAVAIKQARARKAVRIAAGELAAACRRARVRRPAP